MSKIDLQTENVRVLLIMDDEDSTYVLMTGDEKYQWFQVRPGTLKKVEMPLCDGTKRISSNTSFIGQLSKKIAVPTEDLQNEILSKCNK